MLTDGRTETGRADGRTDGRTENRTPISHPATSRCDKNKIPLKRYLFIAPDKGFSEPKKLIFFLFSVTT